MTDAKHLYSPLGDMRDHAVRCARCNARAWNICGHCDRCCPHDPPAAT